MTVLISLYASGYKFNLTWPLKFNRLLQKTGMLNVSTLPKNATIFLNDKPQKKSPFSLLKKDFIATPAKIKNILPGEYTLKLERENYWPFERKIKIESGQTTFAEDINLFRSDIPLLVYPDENNNPILSDNGRYLYLSEQGKIINLKDGSVSSLTAGENMIGRWIKNSNRLFINGKILDPEKNNENNIAATLGQKIAIWYYNDFDGLVYYSNGESINRLEADNRTISTLIKGEKYLDFEPRNDNIFVIVKNENKITLKSYLIKTGTKIGEIELPAIGNYIFKQENEKRICLYDQKNLTLYLIDPANLKDYYVIKGIKSWAWISDEDLIYNSDWEINVFSLKNGQATLVTRVSEAIDNLVWHKNGRYFIFSTETSLNASDLQTGTTIKIFNSEKISAPVLDEKNNLLYFYAKIGQQSGVYKLLLQ